MTHPTQPCALCAMFGISRAAVATDYLADCYICRECGAFMARAQTILDLALSIGIRRPAQGEMQWLREK